MLITLHLEERLRQCHHRANDQELIQIADVAIIELRVGGGDVDEQPNLENVVHLSIIHHC